jgi:MFS family permease
LESKNPVGSGAPLPPVRLAFTVWGLAALFYLMGFYHRVAPAVITQELMRAFSINAAALGNLSAFYFYSYVAMQIPTGIIADRWGPRRLLFTGTVVASAGSLLFALAGNVYWANLGRMLIGGSVAVAFVSMLKLADRWFPARRFALLTGLALFFGIVGAVVAGVPLRLLVDAFGWRPVMLVSAGVTLAIGAAIWIAMRDTPSELGYRDYGNTISTPAERPGPSITKGIRDVFRYRNTWLLSIVPGGIVGCVLTFSGLWGVPFLTTHYHMNATQASAITSALLVAWAVGGPICGALSDRLGRRKPLYVMGTLVLVVCWALVLMVSNLPTFLLIALILLAGLASGCMIPGFAFCKESVPPALSGTAAGVVNMGVMLGPTLLQPIVGLMMDRNWEGQLMDGVRIYGLSAYRAGFTLMLGWAILSAVLILFTRETHCRQAVS